MYCGAKNIITPKNFNYNTHNLLQQVTMTLPTLNDYAVIEKIGSGGYATVYKALKKVCTLSLIILTIKIVLVLLHKILIFIILVFSWTFDLFYYLHNKTSLNSVDITEKFKYMVTNKELVIYASRLYQTNHQ